MSRALAMLPSQGAWPRHTYAHIVLRNNNQILHAEQSTREENYLHSRPRMLTHDLFAVANLLVYLC